MLYAIVMEQICEIFTSLPTMGSRTCGENMFSSRPSTVSVNTYFARCYISNVACHRYLSCNGHF